MRTDILGHAHIVCQLFDDVKNHDAGNVFTSFADKYVVFKLAFDFHGIPIDEIRMEFIDCSFGNGNKALLVSFPFDFDESLF